MTQLQDNEMLVKEENRSPNCIITREAFFFLIDSDYLHVLSGYVIRVFVRLCYQSVSQNNH